MCQEKEKRLVSFDGESSDELIFKLCQMPKKLKFFLLSVPESDSEEEAEDEELDSEGEESEDGEVSSLSSGPSRRSEKRRSNWSTRNSVAADRKKTGKHSLMI